MSIIERLQAATYVAMECDPGVLWDQVAELLVGGVTPARFDVAELVPQP
jgi:hypothetical protein